MDKFRKKNEKPREREAAPEGELCWGRNPVISLLEESPERCMKVLVSETMQPHVKTKIISLCREAGVVFQNAGQAALDRLTNGENHQGVAAYLTQAKLWDADELLEKLPAAPEPVMILLCDHVQDPHNLGAMIRSAEAAGASAVLIPKRGGCLPTGTVIKTSAGAALRVPVALTGNVAQTVRKLQEAGFWVTGLDMNGRDTLFREDLPPRSAIVVGAEGSGLGTATAKACDDVRLIPMRGTAGSLNASVAAASRCSNGRAAWGSARKLSACARPRLFAI